MPAYLLLTLKPSLVTPDWRVLRWRYFPPELCGVSGPAELRGLMLTAGNPDPPVLSEYLEVAGREAAHEVMGQTFADLGVVPQTTAVRLTHRVQHTRHTEEVGGYWNRVPELAGCVIAPTAQLRPHGWTVRVAPLLREVAATFPDATLPKRAKPLPHSCTLMVHCLTANDLL